MPKKKIELINGRVLEALERPRAALDKPTIAKSTTISVNSSLRRLRRSDFSNGAGLIFTSIPLERIKSDHS